MNHRLLLLDTGPIREMLAYQAVHILGFQKLRTELAFFSHSAAFERFGRFISPFLQKTTTSAVIVELHYWIRKTDAPGHSTMWSLVYDEFRSIGMEEQTVKLLEMRHELVARCGPTDSSLLHLAERNVHLRPVVITIDDEFHAECSRGNIQTFHLREIVA